MSRLLWPRFVDGVIRLAAEGYRAYRSLFRRLGRRNSREATLGRLGLKAEPVWADQVRPLTLTSLCEARSFLASRGRVQRKSVTSTARVIGDDRPLACTHRQHARRAGRVIRRVGHDVL